MNEKSDEIELKANVDGVSIKTTGNAATRLANQLADIISPFSGIFGTAGDAVNRYRLYREDAAAAALKRAAEIRQEKGLGIDNISPKVLAPWIEGASSEDITGDNITEIWATILASSDKETVSIDLIFIGICKSLSFKDAKFFKETMDYFYIEYLSEYISPDAKDMEFIKAKRSTLWSLAKARIQGNVHGISIAILDQAREAKDASELYDLHPDFEILDIPYFSQSVIRCESQNSYASSMFFDEFSILTSLDLFSAQNWSIHREEITVSLDYYSPTRLAFEFYERIRDMDDIKTVDIAKTRNILNNTTENR